MTIVMALIGFVSPFLPTVLKLIQSRLDNAHELKMFGLQMQMQTKMHEFKMQETEALADIQTQTAALKPLPSYGVRLLDAAKDSGMWKPLVALLVVLYSILDWLSGMVRPAITYAAFAFYITYKWARFEMLQAIAPDETKSEAIAKLWDSQDWNVLVLVLSYWFGLRASRYAFGKR